MRRERLAADQALAWRCMKDVITRRGRWQADRSAAARKAAATKQARRTSNPEET
jgi:hypothetical protein